MSTNKMLNLSLPQVLYMALDNLRAFAGILISPL